MTRQARVAVVYYSATGNVHRLAHALAEGAVEEGAEVRIRHVEELASELLISHNQRWGRHRSEVEDEPVATLDDLSGPTESPSALLRASATSPRSSSNSWIRPGSCGRRASSRIKSERLSPSSMTTHGGEESTILALNNTLYHWGMLILPLGYTASEVFNAGGNRRHLIYERQRGKGP